MQLVPNESAESGLRNLGQFAEEQREDDGMTGGEAVTTVLLCILFLPAGIVYFLSVRGRNKRSKQAEIADTLARIEANTRPAQ